MRLRPFQIVLISIFSLIAVIGLIFFANFRGFGNQNINPYGPSVEIWGTLDRSAFNSMIDTIEKVDDNFSVVRYREVDERQFELQLLNAIAEGEAPDLIIIPHNELVRYRARLLPITYETIPERAFRDTYVEGADVFALEDGVYALPLAVDPLLMFWNRDIFANNGLVGPPRTWEILRGQTTITLTERTTALDITQSAVGMGEYANIKNAKAILSLLLIQAGSKLVSDDGERYRVDLNEAVTGKVLPLDISLAFYTEFSNRLKETYTWNRALPLDRNHFAAGDLGLYFGFGSEVTALSEQNPNLNFDIAPVPQGAGATAVRGYGTFYGLGILEVSNNPQGAFAVASLLTREDVADVIAADLGLAPVQRATIATGDPDPFRQVIVAAALTARGWLELDPDLTDGIFKDMVEDVTSGRLNINDAATEAVEKMELSL